jgi:hypothetical protein
VVVEVLVSVPHPLIILQILGDLVEEDLMETLVL